MEQFMGADNTSFKQDEKAAQHMPRYYKLTAVQRVYLPFKRLLAIVLSLVGIVVASPLILVISIAIKLDSKGPVFYNQTRVGKNGRHFLMYKFRSMVSGADKQIEELKDNNEMEGILFKIKNDPRITRVGRFLRRTSMDELPQLLNVLLGHMTIVGPRPILPAEYEMCSPSQRTCSFVTPGLTCYWQISGRSNLKAFDDRVKLDMKYIESMGPVTDLLIILKTIPAVISGNGAH